MLESLHAHCRLLTLKRTREGPNRQWSHHTLRASRRIRDRMCKYACTQSCRGKFRKIPSQSPRSRQCRSIGGGSDAACIACDCVAQSSLTQGLWERSAAPRRRRRPAVVNYDSWATPRLLIFVAWSPSGAHLIALCKHHIQGRPPY